MKQGGATVTRTNKTSEAGLHRGMGVLVSVALQQSDVVR